MRHRYARAARAAVVAIGTAAVAAACSASPLPGSAPAGLSGPSGPPITVGISLPLTGGFQADGIACEQGYQLWVNDVNRSGGLLGRPVKLIFLNDNSDPARAAKNYTTLIHTDHVNLVLGGFSTLLTVQSAPVAAKAGYAFVEGAGGGPSVFQLRLHNLFAVSTPVQYELVPLVNWVKTLTGSQRPTTAAYPMVNDPFADPPVLTAKAQLEALGIRTVWHAQPAAGFPVGANGSASQAALTAAADGIAASGAQMVVIGSVDVPTVSTFIREFARKNYTPKILIATSGPDQGQAFISAVGGSANGVMVPNGWYGGIQNALSHVMVQDYIAKYGGTASDINADVAEMYSAGQVLAAAVTATGGLNNSKIIAYLHNHGTVIQTVQGAAQFGSTGTNMQSIGAGGQTGAFIFQWQPGQRFEQVLPNTVAGAVNPIPWAG